MYTHSKSYLFICLLYLFISCTNKKDIEISYYSNGNIKTIAHLKNGVLNGQKQWFFEDGTLEEIVIFDNNIENGNAYYFYKSGAIKYKRHWRNAKMNGYVSDYYDDTVGIVKAVLLFNDNGEVIYKKHFDSLGHFIKQEGTRPN